MRRRLRKSTDRATLIRQYYTTEQAAKFLGFAGQTMCNWRNLGVGPNYIMVNGRNIRYKHEDLIAFMESQRKIKTLERVM